MIRANALPRYALLILIGAGLSVIDTRPMYADGPSFGGGKRSSKCGKYKKGSRKWKRCMRRSSLQQEDTYALGYWLAKTGEYQDALDVLGSASNPDDARVLTMIGFATRRLGRVDEALGYYGKALAKNPDLTSTRQYLGEALLQKDDPAGAKRQLAEIRSRCGVTCKDYRLLALEIAKFESTSGGRFIQ